MPIRLTPDEIQAQFSTGSRAEAPEAGLGTRFGAAVDRAQAGLYGIGEAVGLPLADARMANQAAQEQSMQRYFADNPNDPQSYKDIDSVASALKYIRGLGIDASPELVTSLLTGGAGALAGLGTAGRVGLAAAANYPAALGDILQNQREEAGRTNLGVAAGLAVPYAAADLVGLDAALAGGRMARTGIQALDRMQGVRGGLARTGANVALNAPVEGASETFQELVNQAGRVAVSPRAEMFSPEAQERYMESFVGGAALGGAASAAMGGWRRSEAYQRPETDLLAPKKPAVGLAPEFVGPPAFVGPAAPQRPADFVGPAPELVGPSAPQDLTAPAAPTAEKAAGRQANVEFRNTYGIVPTPYNKEIVQAIEAEGFTWDSPEVVELRNYVEQQPLNKKRLEKALEQLDTLALGLRQPAPQTPVAAPVAAQPTVTNVAQAPQAIQAAPQGQAALPAAAPVTPAAPVAPAAPAVSQALIDSWDAHRDDTAPAFEALPANMQKIWADAVTAKAQNPKINLFKAAEELVSEGVQQEADPRRALLGRIFGERDGEIIFDVVGSGMSQEEAAAKYNLSRAAIEKIAGTGKAASERRAARIKRAMDSGVTQEQIVAAMAPAQGSNDTESMAIRNMFSGVAIDPLLAQEAGLEGNVETAGGSEANTGALLSDLEKELFALLEQRADESIDAATMAKLDDELAKITEVYKTLEKAERAKVRATAGAEDTKAEQPKEVGAEDAVQVESTAKVPVRKRAKAGKGVGQEVRRAEEPAGAQQALTEAEQAGQAWDKVASEYPSAPKFADLTEDQRQDFIDYGPDNWTKADVETELTKLTKSGAKFGKDGAVKDHYTADELLKEISAFVRADIPGRKLVVVQTVGDLLTSPDKNLRVLGASIALEGAYGVASNGRAVLIADRIQKGQGRAKFMHEVGAHLGLENLLPKALYDRLTSQILTWAKRDDGSIESELALNAVERVQSAGTKQEDRRSEMLAYFIEEAVKAGIDPTADAKASGPLKAWFRTLWAAFKVAVRKLGFNPDKMTAQDVVNLAFGAARLEISGAFHGTAAQFRKFNHKFMGSGEGAQAYGWGTYLAQRAGIAKGYWSADVARKDGVNLDAPAIKVGNKTYTYSDGGSTQSQMEYVAAEWLLSGKSADELNSMMQKTKDATDKDSFALARKWKLEGKVATKVGGTAGSFMRVDTAITPEETLDWDRPLSKQPAILEKLGMLMPRGLQEALADQYNQNIEDLGDLTGEDLYRGLRFLEKREGLVSEFWGTDDYVGQSGKKVASLFLDSMGIKGLQFLDAKSRGGAKRAVTYDGTRYDWDQLSDLARNAFKSKDDAASMKFNILRDISFEGLATVKAQAKQRLDEFVDRMVTTGKESSERFGLKFDEAAERARAEKMAATTAWGERLAWIEANEASISVAETPRTRNLVVFNDKNIFRVGSAIGADKQRMKFGKDAGARPGVKGIVDRSINKLPKDMQQPANNIVGALADVAGRGLDYVVFTGDLVGRAVKAGMYAATSFEKALAASKAAASERERRVEKIADMYAEVEEVHKGRGPGTVNDFLFESTRTGKWGYGKYRDDAMGSAFDALGPKAQAFVKAVFAHGDTTLSEKKRIVLDSANSEYDAMIAIAKRDGDTNAETALKKEKAATLARFQSLFKIREGLPYAPIKRTGPWAVVSRSPEYAEAVAAGDTKAIKEMEQNPEHYQVSFVDSKWEARSLAAKVDSEFSGMETQVIKRAEAMDEFSGDALLPALTKLRARVDSEKGTANTKVLNIISQLYLEALAEDSARKSEMRRRGISGEVDMLASFATQGRADANFMASVEHNPKIQEALQQLRAQSKQGDVTRRTEIFDELSKRYVESLDYNVNPWVQKLVGLSSKYFLATSPGYYIQNLTQPFMWSVPAMAGRHDYTAAGQALWKAYSELGPLFKNTKLFDQQFDFTQVPSDVKDAVDELVKRGKIDIGLATEINEFKVDADGNLSKFAQKLNKGMRMAVQKTEAINRLSTAMAAYRLELKRTGSESQALEYADRILTETHGDYTAFNAPRIFNSNFGKVALQFRKFQLVQIAFYAKLIRDAYSNPAERKAALRTLGFSLAHTGIFAGAMGLPGYAAVAAVMGALFGDDDEPFDLTEWMRKKLGPEWSQLVMRGAPTMLGVDLSGKIGAGNMLSVAPFMDVDLTTQAGVYQAIGTIAGGAAGGMTARMADGLGLMMSGDVYRGLEQTMPKGIGDMLKAGRVLNSGMTRRNGDVILSDSDVSQVGAVFAAMGLPSVQQTETYQKTQSAKELETNLTERSSKIKNQYAKAVRAGDAKAMADARDAWKKLQDARRRNELKPQPMSSLLRAPQEQGKREKKLATQMED